MNVIFALTLVFDIWFAKRLEAEGRRATRIDYALAVFAGLVGATFVSSYMLPNSGRSIVQAIIGMAAIAVAVWVLSIYKRLERS